MWLTYKFFSDAYPSFRKKLLNYAASTPPLWVFNGVGQCCFYGAERVRKSFFLSIALLFHFESNKSPFLKAIIR
jgi:hypothetical protein